ncbi:MAG: M43 family zinc metalloprotease [Bacteroidia bacterium]|nr:M43 family zinc metalloprotease [Bacteroidia bacterium]
MNWKLSFLTCLLSIGFFSFAQQRVAKKAEPYHSNEATHSHVTKRTCGTMEHHEHLLKTDPNYRRNLENIERFTQEYIKNNPTAKTGTIITIPVVFHVVYRTAAENIPDSRLNEQLDVLNKDYAKQNSDTNLVPAVWKSLHVDTEIRFCLAQRDPSNNPTTGITRTSTTKTSFSVLANDVKYNSTGGKDAWNTSKYLNIWVCNLGGSVLGYAQFPGGPAATDGVVLDYRFTGKTGALAPYNKGRTGTHEVGHYLNLRHIWGDDPGCSPDDFVADTPTQAGENYGCPTFPKTDACQPSAPGVMFMNYMDYSDDACLCMFTAGQKARMQAALAGPRASLTTSMGCVPVTSGVPNADFVASMTTIPVGSSINFTDLSTGVPTSWSWSFPGATPSSSTLQNPTGITYNTVGTYSVTLTVSNSHGTDTETKVNYINVVSATCDTLNLPFPGTPVIYLASSGGYVAGSNAYSDQSKADKFTGYPSSLNKVTGVIFMFGRGYSSGAGHKVNVRLWNNSGTGGKPGATPLISQNLLVSQIQSDVTAMQPTIVTFSSPVTVGTTFYAGFSFDMAGLNYAHPADTVALITNTDGDTNPATAWEQWNDGTWYAYDDSNSWGLEVAHAIFPIICPTSSFADQAPVDNSYALNVIPNPNNGNFHIIYDVQNGKSFKVEVLNALGQVVYTDTPNNFTGLYNRTVDVSKYSKGLYMVRITDGNSFAIRKVQVQ